MSSKRGGSASWRKKEVLLIKIWLRKGGDKAAQKRGRGKRLFGKLAMAFTSG